MLTTMHSGYSKAVYIASNLQPVVERWRARIRKSRPNPDAWGGRRDQPKLLAVTVS